MVVTCHLAGVILSGAKDRTDGNKYGPEYYSARGENCPPRYDKDMEEFFSMGEEYSTSSAMVSGYAMICTSLMMLWHPNLLTSPPEHLQYD